MNLTKALTLANDLMREHGLAQKGWYFNFDRSVRRFGACHYNQRKITLSEKLTAINDESHVRNTLLHEIAHALAGHKAGHGPQWVATAKMLGCDGQRLYDGNVVTTVSRKYTGTCPNCGRQIQRHRRQQISCGQCCKRFNGGKFTPEYLFTWTAS
jgi:predicted SprT family Zn-dependent metalloprotease